MSGKEPRAAAGAPGAAAGAGCVSDEEPPVAGGLNAELERDAVADEW